ncbi:2-isopropylmalate synthase [Pseudonocardia spinosispora]|uniref:2-isopropylmalate synthase n=1 Tax=Pseudonocardia spinosispora TaxID=103441 RepID=UPI000428D72D|nr:2-isopropylmalate synthase [Pseudonocardia spinosispora]
MYTFPTLHTPGGPIPDGQPWWNRQRRSSMPSHRYLPAHERVAATLTDRTWPDARIEHAPLWVPVDLRDGNQALAEPMDPDRKRRMFDLFVAMGFTEIEVGYPSASRTDFDFVRSLAEPGAVPDDVTIVVFTPARKDLIERTFESIVGIERAVVHLYTATAPIWRDVVLGQDRSSLRELIVAGADDVARCARTHTGDVRFEFSPEVFNQTEPDFALEVCNAVTATWEASPERPVILNLPATVEIATPDLYADQIEYMSRHLQRRDSVILSVHPHNDRGTGVACAELALKAGAQRVEGCLFGNGERTGNVDLVTLALNLHTQGVDPQIDFSDIDEIRRTVEHCNRLGVHERHPYVGDLVHTAFSGTHQDAIKKGMAAHTARAAELDVPESELPWQVPYLPIDPAELGRNYDEVIRVNSQSGKGGIAYLLHTHNGLDLPRRLQIEFAKVVQRETDATGREIEAKEIWELFSREYLLPGRTPVSVELLDWRTVDAGGRHRLTARLRVDGSEHEVEADGAGPLSAFAAALRVAGIEVEVLDYRENATRAGEDSPAAAYVEVRIGGVTRWGVGIDHSLSTASLYALLSAINRTR